MLLFDMGAGTFSRLVEYINPKEVRGIFISHWHSDHCSDLLILEYFMQLNSQQDPAFLTVYGPEDEKSPVYQKITDSPFFKFIPIKPWDIVKFGEIEVQAGPAKHPVPCVGYKVGSWGYTGDTNWLAELTDFYKGVQWLFACGCVLDKDWSEENPHLSGVLAAQLAGSIGCKQLYLTHLKPNVDMDSLLLESVKIFSNTQLVLEGRYQFKG